MLITPFSQDTPTMPAASERKKTWVSRADAARILDADPRVLEKLVAEGLVAEGLVGVRQLPVRAKYRRQDIEALVRLSLVPARLASADAGR